MRDEGAFVALVMRRLGVARPRRRERVIIQRWQPQKWNGKKWVRAGKLETGDGEHYVKNANGLDTETLRYLPRPVERDVLVAPAIPSLESAGEYIKDSNHRGFARIVALCRGVLRDRGVDGCGEEDIHAALGEVADILGIGVNVKSTSAGGATQWYLYDYCKFDKQYKRDKGEKTVTTDDEAILSIYARTKDIRALDCLRLRSRLTESSNLDKHTDNDGRMRCGYNLVGTETARLSCYESPTGSGFNLQTVTENHRRLFKADAGCIMAQCDLRGADGWTVAAEVAAVGDRTMLDDLQAGLQPNKIMTLIYEHGSEINRLEREALRARCNEVDKKSWKYFANKRVCHSGAYGVGEKTMSGQILTDSYKKSGEPIYVEPAVCRDLLEKGFMSRYTGIRRWHDRCANLLMGYGEIRASCGFRRAFHGRKKEYRGGVVSANKDTLKQFLAHLPQVNTTHATKLALWRLWSDASNRREDGSLRVEPLHSMHDSLNAQSLIEDKDYMRGAMRVWFNNPIEIAGTTVTIPFDGTMSDTWGMENAEKI